MKEFKEKLLMTSYGLSNLADGISTGIGVTLGAQELNPVLKNLIGPNEIYRALVFKTAVTATLIGIYALAAKQNGRWKWPVENAIKILNVVTWGVVVWNTININSLLK